MQILEIKSVSHHGWFVVHDMVFAHVDNSVTTMIPNKRTKLILIIERNLI